MDTSNLTPDELLALVEQSNAKAKQLNDARLMMQGRIETDRIAYEKSVVGYQEKYGVVLDDTNLEAEGAVVLANLKTAHEQQVQTIERIERGEYAKAKPIIHESNKDKVDENGVLKEGFEPITSERVGVAEPVGETTSVQLEQQPEQSLVPSAPVAPVAPAPQAPTTPEVPQAPQAEAVQAPTETPMPKPPTVSAEQPQAPTQQSVETKPYVDPFEAVQQQQQEIVQEAYEQEMATAAELAPNTAPSQPAPQAPSMPTAPQGGGLNWTVPNEAHTAPQAPVQPVAPVAPQAPQAPQMPQAPNVGQPQVPQAPQAPSAPSLIQQAINSDMGSLM